MVWWIQPQEIADEAGKGTGRWRMTAKSDEGGGGPYGDTSHDHATAEEAEACEACDEYVNRWAGFPSRKRVAEDQEKRDRAEYERLKEKFEPRPRAEINAADVGITLKQEPEPVKAPEFKPPIAFD